MGRLIETFCRSCGFRNKFLVGGVKFSDPNILLVPALNRETQSFEMADYFKHEYSGKFYFYSDEKLKGEQGNFQIINSNKFSYYQENNYCPICKNYTWAFRATLFCD